MHVNTLLLKNTKPKYKKAKYIQLANINGKTKRFNQEIFDKYDTPARKIIIDLLGEKNVGDNPDKYGEDLVVIAKSIPFKFIEIQVYASWKEKDFPYDQPYIPARKMRFSKKTLFMCFNNDLNHIIMFSRKYMNEKSERLKKYDREMVNFVDWRYVTILPLYKLTKKEIQKRGGLLTSDTEDSSSDSSNN